MHAGAAPIAGSVIACTALLASLLAGCGLPPASSAPQGTAVVEAVVDGDTLRVQYNGTTERVRLIGIDTPETHGRGGLVECFGAQASDRLAQLTPPGTTVTLQRDVEARDRYDRLLAYVYVGDQFVNATLVSEGYAAALSISPNTTYAAQLGDAANQARSNGLGLWGACGGPDTPITTSE